MTSERKILSADLTADGFRQVEEIRETRQRLEHTIVSAREGLVHLRQGPPPRDHMSGLLVSRVTMSSAQARHIARLILAAADQADIHQLSNTQNIHESAPLRNDSAKSSSPVGSKSST